MRATTQRVFVTGATGFLGRHLLPILSEARISVRALARGAAGRELPAVPDVEWVSGDLMEVSTFAPQLAGCHTLVHLAFPSGAPAAEQIRSARSLAHAAVTSGVHRIVHCSTAIVAGRTRERVVNERTRCEPRGKYEETKLLIEQVFQDETRGRAQLAILRPTAVFGPGGRNVVKIADQLRRNGALANWLRAALFGRRRLNLVSVSNVVEALVFLVRRTQSEPTDVFIVSDDDDPANNYEDVVALLRAQLGLRAARPPTLHVPVSGLSLLLRVLGRSSVDPDRIYDSSKLRDAGYKHSASVASELTRFAAAYLRSYETAVR